jgi:hypothetical protein
MTASSSMKMTIYDWHTWKGFLLPLIIPEATKISAVPGESFDEIVCRMPEEITDFAFHLCLSQAARLPLNRPMLIDALHKRGIRIINSKVTDVTKRQIQRLLRESGLPHTEAAPKGDPEEMLIIKTNYNYGGEAERRLSSVERGVLGVSEISNVVRNSKSYRVVKRREVTADLWCSPGIVIEKFMRNRENVFFRAYVACTHVAISKARDPALIKKMPIGIERRTAYCSRIGYELTVVESEFSVAPRLLHVLGRLIDLFELDFGAIDIALDEATTDYYVVDVNNTPHWGNGGHKSLLEFLREGILKRADTVGSITWNQLAHQDYNRLDISYDSSGMK